MRRLLIVVGILAVLVSGAVWAVNRVLDRTSRTVMAGFIERTRETGIQVHEMDFDSVGISSPTGATWYGLRGDIEPRGFNGSSAGRYTIRAERAYVGLRSLNVATLEVYDVEVRPAANGSGDVPDNARFVAHRVSIPVAIDLEDPLPPLKEAALGALSLVRSGATTAEIELDGEVRLASGENETAVRVRVEQRGDSRELVADREDLEQLWRRFHERPTEAEIELISKNALRAPRLLRVTETAETRARDAYRRDRSVPEDAYRHVLWSYLLTREFGAPFAKLVTDAHEERSGNSRAELRMDLRNNSVGRGYADDGVPESQILERLLNDPRVIMVPVGS